MPKGTIRPIIPWAKESAEAQMNEDVRDKARTLGLDRLTEEHLAQFERATTGMERHLQRLPRGMPTAQELAHVYRAKGDMP